MYEFERVLTNDVSNAKHAALLGGVFEKPQLFTQSFVKWQYADNPSGQIVGFNAMEDNVIAAHYVTQPFYAKLNGETHKGLLSLNTATHSDHRGKGLFTKLAEKTYQAAADEGFAFVIGVANQNSVNGFISKLGFQQVGQLDAKIGLGNVPERLLKNEMMYERIWEKDMLEWRLNNPCAKYFSSGNGTTRYFSETHLPFIKAEMIEVDSPSLIPEQKAKKFFPLTLYIGKDSSLSSKSNLFFDIPQRFRPSPLYLIFKDLTGKSLQLDFNNIRFRLIDFDAY